MFPISIGFGWVLLAVFLFINLIWALDMTLTPPPGAIQRKRAPKRTKPTVKRMIKRSPLPMIRLQHTAVGKPVAQPVP